MTVASAVVVSTECPSCAAPLDFTQGANAIRCAHCNSTLLVTGHKRVLSYHVVAALDATGAMALVKAALGERHVRVGESRLYFVPYYRLTGHEFRWVEPEPPPNAHVPAGVLASVLERAEHHDVLRAFAWAATTAGQLLSTGTQPLVTPGPRALAPRPRKRGAPLTFQDRYVDRSFIAVDVPEFPVPSLGVRASVMTLHLFHRRALETGLRAVPPELPTETALARGMEPPDAAAIVHRTVLDRVLSIIYVPFWLVTLDTDDARVAIVDAVAQRVVTVDAAPSLVTRLERAPSADGEIVGFRPLVCPNCGWDLPLRPDDVTFFCARCERAWQLRGTDLLAVESLVADVPAGDHHTAVVHLPCWVLDTDARPGTAPRLFVPAFRFQRLRFLSDLALRLTARQPSYTALAGPRPELRGCHYDVEDAILLGRFIELGAARGPDIDFTVRRATLTWFPFAQDRHEILDPFTGLALPGHLFS